MSGRGYVYVMIGGLGAGLVASMGFMSTQLEAQSPVSAGTVVVDGVTVPGGRSQDQGCRCDRDCE